MTNSDIESTSAARKLGVDLLIAVALLFAGIAWLPEAGSFEEQHPTIDECGWLAISHDTYTHFQNGDLAEVAWKEGLQKTTYGAMNPNLAKLLFGWRLAADDYNLEPPKVFPALYPDARGRMRNPNFVRNRVGEHAPFLESLRGFNLWILALAGSALFLAASCASNWVGGLFAWLLFLSTPSMRDQAGLVMTDNLLLAVLGLGVVLAMLFLSRFSKHDGNPWTRFAAMAGLGLILGLTPSTKLNGALSCIAFGIAILLMFFSGRFQHGPRWQPLAWAGLAGSWAVAIFLALYPFLWNGVSEGLTYILDRWDVLIGRQAESLPILALDSLGAKTSAVWEHGLLNIGPSFLPSFVLLGLVVAGFLLLSYQAIRSIFDRTLPAQALILWIFTLTWVLATMDWIPIDWARYYLPVQWFACILAAWPLAKLWTLMRNRLRPRPQATTATATAFLLFGLMPLASCTKSETAVAQGPVEPPHILLLTVDTLRPDVLGMYGYDRETSPYLDGLLADAFHFPKTVSTVPRTTPALASLLTGSYPHTTGVRVLMHALREDVTPITEVLKQDGYGSLAIVTNQMLGEERKLNRGFDTYLPARDSRDAKVTTDLALETLATYDFTQPLFFWMHYIDPHMPYVSDPAIIQQFDPDYEGRYKHQFGQFPDRKKPGARRGGGPYPPDLPKRIAVHRNPLPEEVNAHIRRLYAADVRSTDDQIRRLVEGLKEKTGDNLLIVFTSDHGESLGEHDFYWDHGDYVYNAASRVPFAILLPENHPAAGAGSYPHWVSGVDMVPTLLDLLGREVPESMVAQMEGRSLAPAMRGETLPGEPVFIESGRSHFFDMVRGRADNSTDGKFRAVIAGDWKLIWAPGHSDADLSWHLFHLATDPDETKDLYAADHPEFERLVALLQPWVALSPTGKDNEAISEADMEFLQELGYVGEDDE